MAEKQEKSLQLISQTAAGLIAVYACLALFSRLIPIPGLKYWLPGLVAMNPTAAVLFFMTAFGLGLQTFSRNHSKLDLLRFVTGGLIFICGLAASCGFWLDWQIERDNFLFAELLGENRMAPNTAIYFTLVGLAFLTIKTRSVGHYLNQMLAVTVLGGALISVLGYAYGTRNLYGIGKYIPLELNTGVLFAGVAVGLLCAAGPRGLLAIFCSAESGSVLVRRLLPTAVVVPSILGFLRLLGQRAGWYDTEFGTVLMVAAMILLLMAAIGFTARALNRNGAERLRDADVLQAAHLELQSQTHILQSILNSMGDGVVVANEHGQFMQFNPAAERILGIGTSEVGPEGWTSQYGCFLPDCVTPYPPEQLPLARAIRGEAIAEEELFIRNASIPHGAWISVTGQPLREASGALKGGVIVFRDVSERKRIEGVLHDSHDELEFRVAQRTEELRRAKEMAEDASSNLAAILQSSVDAIITMDHEGNVSAFNPAAETMFGYSEAEALGKPLAGLIIPQPLRAQHSQGLARCVATGTSRVLEKRLELSAVRADGGEFPVELTITKIPVEGPPRFTGFLRDITERKRVADQVQALNAKLEHQLRQLTQVNRELSQKNQENEMFVYSVSHDLRSPLVNLQGFSKELEGVAKDLKASLASDAVPEKIRTQVTTILDGDLQQFLHFIKTAVTRLGNIIDALLRLSRIGRVEYQSGPVDIQALVDRVLDSMSASMNEAGISVCVHDLPPCYGDETALEQLFANLLGNAVKYRDPRRACTIEVGFAGEEMTLAGAEARTYYVKDNGLGIPAAHQEKIFQAFKRAHPHVASGEGMGLAIVQRTAERHGGTAWVESQEGQGSTFYITLPVRVPALTAEPRASGAVQGENEHGSGIHGDLVGGRR